MLSFDPLKRTCIALAIAQTLAIPTAQAATIIVNTTGDTDGNDQACTLREAIVSIHDSSPASKGCTHSGIFGVNDTVGFHPGLNDQIIQLEQGLSLLITKNLTINGLGEDRLTIDRIASNSRIFSINNATVQINDLKITGGRDNYGGAGIRASNSNLTLSNITVSGNSEYASGSDFEFGGGIAAFDSSVSLNNCTVSDNSAWLGGGGILASGSSNFSIINSTISGNSVLVFRGGSGILMSSTASVSLTNSTVSGNSSGADGGGILVWGSSPSLSLINSTVSGNSADNNGGGIFTKGIAGVNLTNSTVSGNSAGNNGGGIHTEDLSVVNLTNSTVSSNTATSHGGGISNTNAAVDLVNSTMSNNSATKSGGGILFGGDSSNPSHRVTLINSTLTGNNAGDDGGGIGFIGGRTILKNSIISGNQADDLSDEIGGWGGIVLADRNNLFGDSTKTNAQAFGSSGATPAGSTVITATSNGTMPTALTSILQTTLKNNGGPTKTHALVVGSPAIDAGHPAVCASAPVNNKDQRGESRPAGVACDIGAFEFGASISFFVVPLSNGKKVIFGL